MQYYTDLGEWVTDASGLQVRGQLKHDLVVFVRVGTGWILIVGLHCRQHRPEGGSGK